MTTETRNNGVCDCTVLVASQGKELVRLSTGERYGREICLGYSYYIGGERQSVAHRDTASDFGEVDAEEEEEEK